MDGNEEEEIIDEFMAENGRAAEWRAMRESLRDRLRALRSERSRASTPDAIAPLDKRIAQVIEQIAAIETEEAVSQFVEDSVRAALRGSVRRFVIDDEDEED